MNPGAGALPSTFLYECTVVHERFHPRSHRFVYRLFYFAIDLDDLGALHRRLALFSVNRANVFSFHESDFLPTHEGPHNPTRPPGARAAAAGPQSLKSRVLAFCAAHGVDPGPGARVILVTLPRLFGFHFNPVSFYFCFDASWVPACAIAEVTNTFREMKPFFVSTALGAAGGVPSGFRLRTAKHFYVSPFSELDAEFDFILRLPSERLAVQIDEYAGGGRTLHSAVTGVRAALTNGRLAWFLLKYPLATLRIVALIHWQAFLLWGKKVPFFRKAASAADQRDLYRPHPSITRPPTA